MSFTLLGILNSQAAGGADSYWMLTLDAVLGSEDFGGENSLATDPNGNIGFVSNVNADSYDIGFNDWYLFQLDTDGNLLSQKNYGKSGDFALPGGIKFDSVRNNEWVVTGYQRISGQDCLGIANFDSTGAISNQVNFGDIFAESSNAKNNRVDVRESDGDYYICYNASGRYGLMRFQSDSFSSGYVTRVTGANERPSVAHKNSSVYVTTNGSDSIPAHLIKHSDGGTLGFTFQRTLSPSLYYYTFNDLVIDDSENIYVCGVLTTSGPGSPPNSAVVAKFNSSGTLQWVRELDDSTDTNSLSFRKIELDSNGDLILLGTNDFAMFLGKFDSSGNLLFQRRFATGPLTTFSEIFDARGLAIDPNDNIIISGASRGLEATNSLDIGFVFKVPNDGSLTGTYTVNTQSITYEATSYTVVTPSTTTGTGSATASAPSPADQGDFSSSTPNFTTALTEIG